MAFDLGKMLAEVSDSDTGREQIEYIRLDVMDRDPNNFYQLSGIEDLAANIATCGLQQPIRVWKSPEGEGRYRIVSGHRRHAALTELRKDDPDRWGEVPCIVERDEVSPALQQLRLIYANANTRTMTSAEIGEQAAQVEKLLYQLKEEGYEFPGRMRDHVAQAVGASTTKLAKLKLIRENLSPAWKPLYNKGTIKESVAYALAQMPKDWQTIMHNAWKNNFSNLYEGHVRNATEKFKQLSSAKCKLDPHCRCWSNRARVDHIASMGQYDNGCSGCCLDCYNLRSCKYSCAAADGRKQDLKETERNRKREKKAKEQSRIQPVCDYTRGVYARWLEAKDANGLSTEEYLKACGKPYYRGDAETFDKYAGNPEKINAENIKLPFVQNIWPSDAMALCEAADVLGCSIDWLLGRNVEKQEVETVQQSTDGWNTGNPKELGTYVVLATSRRGGELWSTDLEWNGLDWVYDVVFTDHDEVRYWMPMPEE